MTKAFLVYPGFDVDEEWNKALHNFHRQVVGHNVAVLTGALYPKRARDVLAPSPLADARAKAIADALLKIDVEARTVDCRHPDWRTLIMNYEAVILDSRGQFGADGSLQGFLDVHCVPYTGPGAHDRAVTYDRFALKAMLRAAEIAAPDFVGPSSEIERLIEEYRRRKYSFPVCFRSRLGGSQRSDLIQNAEGLLGDAIWDRSGQLLLEAQPRGPLLSVSAIEVLDGWLLLPPLEYEADATEIPSPLWSSTTRKFWCPKLSNDLIYDLFNVAKHTILTLRCKDVAIVYFSLAEGPQVLGIDVMPELGPDDALVYSAAQVRFAYEILLLNVLASAYRASGLTQGD